MENVENNRNENLMHQNSVGFSQSSQVVSGGRGVVSRRVSQREHTFSCKFWGSNALHGDHNK